MVDITITKMNETYIRVVCAEVHMEMEIQDRFSFEVPNAKHDPRVKAGRWDGIRRLYNRTHKRMYTGLLFELMRFLKKQGYTYSVAPELVIKPSVELDDIKHVCTELIKPHDKGHLIELYDYQYDAVHYMLNMNRTICLAATSAGKSVSIYAALRLYQLSDDMAGKHMIVIVPSKLLVEQMYSDFENYSTFEGATWNARDHCQRVSSDHKGPVKKQIVITTWQSLKNIPGYMISDAGAIFVDEAHTVKGPVLASFLELAVNCGVRHGLTGTLNDFEADELSAQGLLGPSKRIVTSREIIDAGRATDVTVNMIILDYDVDTKRKYAADQMNVPATRSSLKYNSEVNFINNLDCRKKLINDIALKLKGNTIILFDRVEEYGIKLYDEMKEKHDKTFLIVGDVGIKDRVKIKDMLENVEGAIVYATSSIMSTGISIKNLHNIIFASSSKSKIRVLQSIGRLMRLHESKSMAQLIDFVDKLDHKGMPNFTLKHCEERIKFYSREKYKTNIMTMKMIEPDSTRIELI